jgi:hypothetical protein
MCAAYRHLLESEDHDLSLLTRPETQMIDLQLPPDRFSANNFENSSFENRHEILASTVPNARQRLPAQGELATDGPCVAVIDIELGLCPPSNAHPNPAASHLCLARPCAYYTWTTSRREIFHLPVLK